MVETDIPGDIVTYAEALNGMTDEKPHLDGDTKASEMLLEWSHRGGDRIF